VVRMGYSVAGAASLGLGVIGAILPLLPTVPFVLFAAFCFARSNPRWEHRLLEHPAYGIHIKSWRERGAIRRSAKLAAYGAFVFSGVASLLLMSFPWFLIPLVTAIIGPIWVGSRPED
jgi:uncharacterized protein